jgi:glycerol kinase
MSIIQSAAEINTLAAKEEDTGGLYFVTAFSSGLFAPYWDPAATGLMIGISQYTNPSHIARATLEANAFQTKAIIESMKLDSGQDLKNLKVGGGMTNGDLAMNILADIGGFDVIRPKMRECVFILFSRNALTQMLCRSTALGSAICAGAAIGLFGWDLSKPESFREVNEKAHTVFRPRIDDAQRAKKWVGWQKAIERSKGWDVEN